MAKLALFIPNLLGGGAERCFINLAQGLSDRGHEVDLVVTRKLGPYLNKVPTSVRLIDLNVGVPLLSFFKFSSYLKKERPQIVYSALNQANVAAIIASAISGTHTPIAIGVHNSLSMEARNATSVNLKMMPYFVKVFYPLADYVIAVSDGVADDLHSLTGIERSKIDVIYNPVIGPNLFDRAAEPIEHAWFQPGHEPVIVAVGRLSKQKDYETLIRAFAIAQAKLPCRLMILGEGEERPRLALLIQQLGLENAVCLPGFVDNPYAYMKNASLFAMSSIYEGLPTVLIEALAIGCSIVSTDCPSGPREILQGGKHGALVPVGDVESLAKGLRAGLEQPGATSAETWEPYLFETATRKYEQILVKDLMQHA